MKKLASVIVILLLNVSLMAQHHEHHSTTKEEPAKKVTKKAKAVSKPTSTKKVSTSTKAKAASKATINKTVATDTTDHSMHGHADTTAAASEAMHHHSAPATMPVNDTPRVDHNKMHHEQHHKMDQPSNVSHEGHHMNHGDMLMTHAYSLNLPMNRNASGTGWLPDTSPMFMYMSGNQRTSFMLHGNVFFRYNKQDVFNKGTRGDEGFGAPNWFMGMLNKRVGRRGLFNATAMVSLDPITETGRGYPLLFQSGETYKGERLVDRQHPHDFISALSIGYSHAVSNNVDLFGYFGYPGEPALSAPAFMHRISSMNNPDAPLGHHWQDATHIVFGVATAGVRYKNWKAEFSSFTGREPNENRYNFDEPKFDSYSYRLSYNPSRNWALQFSQGFIKSPEVLSPEVNVKRTTASAVYTAPLNVKNGFFATSAIWGLNDQGGDHKEHSVLLEGNLQLQKQAIYSRYEFVQKSSEELALEDELGHADFNIHAFTLGYNHTILPTKHIDVLAGTQATLNFPDATLQPIYGKTPLAVQVYIQVRPSRH